MLKNIIRINCLTDPRLAPYAGIRHRASHQSGDHFIAEGRLIVSRLIESHLNCDSVLLEEGVHTDFLAKLAPNIPIYTLSPTNIRELVGFDFHRGVLACGVRPQARPFPEFRRECLRPDEVVVASMGVSDAANLGTILRTAAAFGVQRVLLGPKTFDPFARRVLRTSMAAVFNLTFYVLDDPIGQLTELSQDRRIRTTATTLDRNATPIDCWSSGNATTVLLLGHECDGIEGSIQEVCTDQVRLPMTTGVDSLNVAVAAGIFLYEARKRTSGFAHHESGA